MNKKEVTITETELRGLIFWAAIGIEKKRGGAYSSTVDFIKNHHELMWNGSDYKNLKFGTALKRLEYVL